jgi:hypothetical protein
LVKKPDYTKLNKYDRPTYKYEFVPKKSLDGIDVIYIDEGGNVPYYLKTENYQNYFSFPQNLI